MSVKPRRTSRRSKPANTPHARRSIRSTVRPDGRDNPQSQQAFTLPDDVVEEALRTGDQPGLLEDLFGPAGYVELRALARQTAARSVRGGKRVMILPGIMGSKLGYARTLLDDTLWFDPIDIAAGRLGEAHPSVCAQPQHQRLRCDLVRIPQAEAQAAHCRTRLPSSGRTTGGSAWQISAKSWPRTSMAVDGPHSL